MPKPVLSDSLFNADDVATAVLAEANLQVTNNDLGVVDRTSLFTRNTVWNEIGGPHFFSFNGFMFCNFGVVYSGGAPASHTAIYTCSDADFRPSVSYVFPTAGRDSDSAYYVYIDSSGKIAPDLPNNLGNASYYIVINGWYRFA